MHTATWNISHINLDCIRPFLIFPVVVLIACLSATLLVLAHTAWPKNIQSEWNGSNSRQELSQGFAQFSLGARAWSFTFRAALCVSQFGAKVRSLAVFIPIDMPYITQAASKTPQMLCGPIWSVGTQKSNNNNPMYCILRHVESKKARMRRWMQVVAKRREQLGVKSMHGGWKITKRRPLPCVNGGVGKTQ